MTAAQDNPPPNFGRSLIGRFLGKAAVRLFIIPVFVLGCWVAGAGLHDPDTCWLAALGRQIFESGRLPGTDPFSYTFAMGAAKPFIMYQWLTELIFYISIHIGGLMGLLYTAAITLYIAFICIPICAFDKLKLPRLRGFGLILLTIAAASFHFLIRPEIFSYLLFSAWLSAMAVMRLHDIKAIETRCASTIDWRLVGLFCAIMALWCNLHTGFTSGLIVLSIYVVFSSLEWLFSCRSGAKPYPYKTAAAALVGSMLSTVLNPNGINLWIYIPALFFSPINKFIIELQPIGLKELPAWQYYPFYLLSLMSIWDCWRSWRTTERAARPGWFPPVMIATLIVLGFRHSRLIPFSSLTLMYEDAWLRSQFLLGKKEMAGIIDYANARAKELFSPDLRWLFLHGVLVVAGVYLIAVGPVKPSLAPSSIAFAFPSEVIAYMKRNPPAGHGFNTPQIGDAMIWYLRPCPQIFIDTRFDMYGADLVNQFLQIAYCHPGWQSALAKYDVRWIFVTPDLPIAEHCSHDSSWKRVVEAKAAVLYIKAAMP